MFWSLTTYWDRSDADRGPAVPGTGHRSSKFKYSSYKGDLRGLKKLTWNSRTLKKVLTNLKLENP